MKIKDLLENATVGDETYIKNNKKEQIKNSFDENLEDYKISDLLKEKINHLMESENDKFIPVIRKFRSMNNTIKIYESKKEEDYITKAYAMMKLDSLVKDYNSILEDIKNPKVMKKINVEHLAESCSLVNYQINKISKDSGYEVMDKISDMPENLDECFNTHYGLLEEVIQ